MKTNASRRLASYLSAGVCVAVTEARADIVVTFYDNPADYPSGINIRYGYVDWGGSFDSFFAFDGTYFGSGLASDGGITSNSRRAWGTYLRAV